MITELTTGINEQFLYMNMTSILEKCKCRIYLDFPRRTLTDMEKSKFYKIDELCEEINKLIEDKVKDFLSR